MCKMQYLLPFFPDPPNVTSLTPASLERLRGQFAVFSCIVTGLPSPPVQWIRNNSFGEVTITPSRFKHSIEQSVQSSSDGPDTVSSMLTIGNLSNIDEGQYICRGINTFNTENFIDARESASVYLGVFGKLIILLRINTYIVLAVFAFVSSSSTSGTSCRKKQCLIVGRGFHHCVFY